MEAAARKRNGVHYTPPKLARFLATETFNCFEPSNFAVNPKKPIRVLDPACGNGELLISIYRQLAGQIPSDFIELVGFEIDSAAAVATRGRLSDLKIKSFEIRELDFLEDSDSECFDLVIANPPYVRTQVLGGAESQRLAKKFELSGRIDLYHAFVVAIGNRLKPGGAFGLLTSNRFLTIKSGKQTRRVLREQFHLKNVFDLGDSKLFHAAVLPAIVTGVRSRSTDNAADPASFCRVCQIDKPVGREAGCLLGQIQAGFSGTVATDKATFEIERGELAFDGDGPWSMTNAVTKRWLNKVRQAQVATFGELAEIKVGIKTTADQVFIRRDWEGTDGHCPELDLIKPLITHHHVERWAAKRPVKSVLYPYILSESRTPIELEKFPQAARYLEIHRSRLESRKYLIEAGRKWFEIWVPHRPRDWAAPKIVWPDISEDPRFFLDRSGAVVNGDCYWIKLRPNVDNNWLYLMLAVANSTIATTFYDYRFHNKLYAKRRRFMTQYVKEFPLPSLDSETSQKIVRLTKKQVDCPCERREREIELLVQQAFGFSVS